MVFMWMQGRDYFLCFVNAAQHTTDVWFQKDYLNNILLWTISIIGINNYLCGFVFYCFGRKTCLIAHLFWHLFVLQKSIIKTNNVSKVFTCSKKKNKNKTTLSYGFSNNKSIFPPFLFHLIPGLARFPYISYKQTIFTE